MFHYFNALQLKTGLAGYYCRLINPTTGGIVTMAADTSGTPIATVSGVANMAVADAAGNFSFYVDPGTYHQDIYGTDATTFIVRIASVPMGSADGASITFLQDGDDAEARTVESKLKDVVSASDFAIVGDALASVVNADDAAFSGAVFAPNGITDLTVSAPLSQSFARIFGTGGGTYRAGTTVDIFTANGASHVNSNLSGFRTYGGRDAIHAGTVGEIARNTYTNLDLSEFARDGFYFTSAVTSSLFANSILSSSTGVSGIYSGGGLNNDNTVSNYHFLNLTGPAIKMLGTVQRLRVLDSRVEGGGVNGQAVFDLPDTRVFAMQSGWYEGHHEYLLKITGTSEVVSIDQIVDIGAKNGGAFKASLFSVGNNLIEFGSNRWDNVTTAPARVFLRGTNDNMLFGSSDVWTAKANALGRLKLKTRKSTSSSITSDLFTFTRASGAAGNANVSTLTGRLRVMLVGVTAGGFTRLLSTEYLVVVAGLGSATMAITTSAITGASVDTSAAAFGFTLSTQAASATSATLRVVAATLNTFESLLSASLEWDSISYTDGNEIAVTPA